MQGSAGATGLHGVLHAMNQRAVQGGPAAPRSGLFVRVPSETVVKWWLVLGALPAFIGVGGGRGLMAGTVAVLVSLYFISDLSGPARFRVGDPLLKWLLGAFVALYAIAFMRVPAGLLPLSTTIGLTITTPLFVACFVRIFSVDSDRVQDNLLRAILWTVPLYVVINVLLLEGGLAVLTEYVGTGRRLINLPSLVGANSIASVTGIALLSLVVYLKIGKHKLTAFIALALVLNVMLATGSRGPTFFALLAAAATVLLPVRILGRSAQILLAMSLISAPIMLFVFATVQQTGLAELLIRTGAENFGVGTGRAQLYEVTLAELAGLNPMHLFGYGYGGVLSSQAMTVLVIIFDREYADVEALFLPTLHNLSLQLIFDVGYVGFALFFLLLSGCIRRLRAMPEGQARFGLGMLIYTMISGFTEATGTPYNLDFFFCLLAVLAMAIGGRVSILAQSKQL